MCRLYHGLQGVDNLNNSNNSKEEFETNGGDKLAPLVSIYFAALCTIWLGRRGVAFHFLAELFAALVHVCLGFRNVAKDAPAFAAAPLFKDSLSAAHQIFEVLYNVVGPDLVWLLTGDSAFAQNLAARGSAEAADV